MEWGRLSGGVRRKMAEMERDMDTGYLAYKKGFIDLLGLEYIAAFRAASDENTPEDLHEYTSPDEIRRISVDVISSAAREVSEATGKPVDVVYKMASMYARLIQCYEADIAAKN